MKINVQYKYLLFEKYLQFLSLLFNKNKWTMKFDQNYNLKYTFSPQNFLKLNALIMNLYDKISNLMINIDYLYKYKLEYYV
jgi:hypothetical protein